MEDGGPCGELSSVLEPGEMISETPDVGIALVKCTIAFKAYDNGVWARYIVKSVPSQRAALSQRARNKRDDKYTLQHGPASQSRSREALKLSQHGIRWALIVQRPPESDLITH